MNREKGTSIYIAVVIMAIMLGVAAGAATLLVGQLKILRSVGYAVISFSAADAGIERILKIDSCTLLEAQGDRLDCLERVSGIDSSNSAMSQCKGANFDRAECIVDLVNAISSTNLSNEATYELSALLGGESECSAPAYCADSTGAFRDAKRKVQISR